MVAYLDLMVVSHILISMMSIRFLNEVDVYRIKGNRRIYLIMITLPLILLIYGKLWLSGVVIPLTYLIIFYFYFKKQCIRPWIEYLMSYYFLSFVVTLLSPNIRFFNLILVVKHPLGLISLLVIPIIYLLFTLVYKAVDAIYHLKNYRVEGIILVNGKKARVRCYFDTGNTVRYLGVPVIFFLKDQYPFEILKEEDTIEVNSLNSKEKLRLHKGMICFYKGSYQAVYIALSERKESFSGCECLLNAYLGG